MKTTLIMATMLTVSLAKNAFGTILPPNNLHEEDDLHILANMTESEFNQISNSIVGIYKPLARIHGATLTAVNNWGDKTVNAFAQQQGNSWTISMFGGLARRPEVTADGFALVVCHELGHHFGGFSFNGPSWAANEGQSDYFATQACARKIWKNQVQHNETFVDSLASSERQKCDEAWQSTSDRALCYRIVAAGQSLANMLATLNNGRTPRFDSPDKSVARATVNTHPAAQCRLDTYLHGALCGVGFNEKLIPGRKDSRGQQSTAAEAAAYKYSCHAKNAPGFARPLCWFKPRL